MRKATYILIMAILVSGPVSAFADSEIKYNRQKAGQFCKKIEINKMVTLPTGGKIKCTLTNSRARWQKV